MIVAGLETTFTIFIFLQNTCFSALPNGINPSSSQLRYHSSVPVQSHSHNCCIILDLTVLAIASTTRMMAANLTAPKKIIPKKVTEPEKPQKNDSKEERSQKTQENNQPRSNSSVLVLVQHLCNKVEENVTRTTASLKRIRSTS
ncbi:hypothetical protein L596_009671 [Steinernema carpocapsae]|uniref:Uncharacterized protein n=1 Tax=Steinernema carpocapsae TaxID=34508 RepID=A0A4U5PG78_STECR|nr:hypothetical protein L596_009671 [Steinernema carpocapsae]